MIIAALLAFLTHYIHKHAVTITIQVTLIFRSSTCEKIYSIRFKRLYFGSTKATYQNLFVNNILKFKLIFIKKVIIEQFIKLKYILICGLFESKLNLNHNLQ